jgi:hypothetical protein
MDRIQNQSHSTTFSSESISSTKNCYYIRPVVSKIKQTDAQTQPPLRVHLFTSCKDHIDSVLANDCELQLPEAGTTGTVDCKHMAAVQNSNLQFRLADTFIKVAFSNPGDVSVRVAQPWEVKQP